MSLPPVVFAIEGEPAPIASDWAFGNVVNLGYDQFRGVMGGRRGRRLARNLDQGSPVVAYAETGAVVWQGRLSAPPKIRQGGEIVLAAQGPGYDAAKSAARVGTLISSQGAWVPAWTPPLDYTPHDNSGGILATSNFQIDVSSSLQVQQQIWNLFDANARSMAVALWLRGTKLARVSYTHVTATQGDGFRVISADGPKVNKNFRVESTYATWSAGEAKDVILHQPGDVIILEVFDNTQPLMATDLTLSNLKVYGTGAVDLGGPGGRIANLVRAGKIQEPRIPSDQVYSQYAAAIVADQMDWDPTGITGKGAAPHTALDWAGSGAAMLSYVADVEDFCWGAWDDRGYGPYLSFDRYGRRVWEVSAATGAVWDLDPLERIRAVVIQFLNIDNTLNQVVVEAPEEAQLPASVTTEILGSLADQQGSPLVALNSAWRKIERRTAQRYRGQISFSRAFEAGTRREATYEVRAGDHIRITDAFRDAAIELPIHSVEFSEAGAVVGVEAPALPLGGPLEGGAGGPAPVGAPLSNSSGGTAVYIPPGTSGGGGSDVGIIKDPIVKSGGGIGGIGKF